MRKTRSNDTRKIDFITRYLLPVCVTVIYLENNDRTAQTCI